MFIPGSMRLVEGANVEESNGIKTIAVIFLGYDSTWQLAKLPLTDDYLIAHDPDYLIKVDEYIRNNINEDGTWKTIPVDNNN